MITSLEDMEAVNDMFGVMSGYDVVYTRLVHTVSKNGFLTIIHTTASLQKNYMCQVASDRERRFHYYLNIITAGSFNCWHSTWDS